MIAATTSSSYSLDHLPVGWFDAVLLVVIVLGFFRGRSNGMTKEVLPAFEWLAIVLLGGLAYEVVGQLFINFGNLKVTAAYILGYLCLAAIVLTVFSFLKKALMPRLTGSNLFGSKEYYLGTLFGILRFVCVLFFALALLHAPFYTPADIAAAKAYNAKTYGGDLKGFSGNFFPSVQTVQDAVFNGSYTGPFIAKYLDVLLINTESVNPVKPPASMPVIHIGS